MKAKKIFYITEKDDPNLIFWKTNKNSRYLLDNGKIFFNSDYDGLIEIELMFVYLKFDEHLCNEINNLIQLAIDNASELSEEPIKKYENTIEKIETIIFSVICKFSHDTKTIFEFTKEIFVKCLMNHPFYNGNKRFSLSFLVLLLRKFGFHFKWTKGTKKDYKKHEQKIKEFIEKLENNSKNDIKLAKQKIENEIVKWIKCSSIISIDYKKFY